MRKNILVALLIVGLLGIAPAIVSATAGNGTNGFWQETSPTLTYKGSTISLHFKAQTDYNFGAYDSFEVIIGDTNATNPVGSYILNNYIDRTVTINSTKKEVTITLVSKEVPYTVAQQYNLKAKYYNLWLDLRKYGDTSHSVDTFGAEPLIVKWNVSNIDLSVGDGWDKTSPSIAYNGSLTLVYEGYPDQFKNITEFPYSWDVTGLSQDIKDNYFTVEIAKVNDRQLRVSITSQPVTGFWAWYRGVQPIKYAGRISIWGAGVPYKDVQVDMTKRPDYTSTVSDPSDTNGIIAQLQNEITAKNATISSLQTQVTALQAQVGTGTDTQTELTELRGLKNTVVSLASDYGATNDSTSGALASYIGQMSSDAKKWTSDGQLRPVSCPTTNCPTCPTCNYSSYVAKATYDGVVAEKTALETQKVEAEAQLKNAVQTRNIYLIGAGLVALVLGLFIGYKSAPKNGNRPRPPVGPPVDQRLKPHRHKGGVPPQSTHVKKKELIGRE